MRLALLVILLAACVDRKLYADDPQADRVRAFDLKVPLPEKFDVLFVIDNSPAMAPYADRIAMHMPDLINVLSSRQGGITDLHLGVITADTGAFRTDGLVGAPFLIDWKRIDGTRSRNYTGELRDQFVRLATVGNASPVIQRPLAAIRRVFEGPYRFHRDAAKLLIVIISAHDDDSGTSIEEEAAYLKQLVTDPTNIMLATSSERPAPRLDALVAKFPNRSTQQAIEDFSGDVLATTSGLGCYRGGGDPCIDRLPAECTFSDVLIENGISRYERPLPHCEDDPTARPCWRFEEDRSQCPDTLPLMLRVLRRDYPADGTHVIGNCVLD